MISLEAWLALRSVKGLSDATLFRLIQRFGSPEAIQRTSIRDLVQNGLSSSVAEAIHRGPEREPLGRIRQELRLVEKGKLSIVSVLDQGYPRRLAMIPDPPPLLYLTGGWTQADDHALAIVGTRNATPGGSAFTEALSQNLASLGFTIVSGLARGIDAAAHRGALKGAGRTVAVLGCGIDRTYPPEHRALRKEIESNGAVLSELPLGSPPRPYHFPRRNRVISGLCFGVVVTEATSRSGALITARFAVEQNREVFAVPGAVKEKRHQGPHGLIKQGAKLVEDFRDILEELLPQLDPPFRDRLRTVEPVQPPSRPDLVGPEREIYEVLSHEPSLVDEILAQARFSPAEVMSILLTLELKGHIRKLPGSHYIRI